jgi:hypothetical protein
MIREGVLGILIGWEAGRKGIIIPMVNFDDIHSCFSKLSKVTQVLCSRKQD